MKEEVSKKAGAIFLLIAIIVAILTTFFILNNIQSPRVDEAVEKESASSGGVSLTLVKPAKIKDEETGIVSLELLPSRD